MEANEQLIWTEERIRKLKELWPNPKLSARAIAAELGVSKDSVTGKAHRLNLPPRPTPIKKKSQRYQAKQALIKGPTAPPKNPRFQIPGIPNKLLHRGRVHNCQWIEAEKRAYHDSDKCQASTKLGRPYCDEHLARAYVNIKGMTAKH